MTSVVCRVHTRTMLPVSHRTTDCNRSHMDIMLAVLQWITADFRVHINRQLPV